MKKTLLLAILATSQTFAAVGPVGAGRADYKEVDQGYDEASLQRRPSYAEFSNIPGRDKLTVQPKKAGQSRKIMTGLLFDSIVEARRLIQLSRANNIRPLNLPVEIFSQNPAAAAVPAGQDDLVTGTTISPNLTEQNVKAMNFSNADLKNKIVAMMDYNLDLKFKLADKEVEY